MVCRRRGPAWTASRGARYVTVDQDTQSIWAYLVQTVSPDCRTFASLTVREDEQSSTWLLGLHQLPLIRRALTEVTYLWTAALVPIPS